MTWILKRFAIRAINRLLKDYDKDVQAFLEKVDQNMRRIQRIAGLFQSLKKRLKDGNISPEEVEETINDIKTTVEEW